jgi:hypothetical protein
LALRHPVLVLTVAAALLLSPSLVLGTLISHSSPQNLTWASQFSEQFRAGVLYPRWMPESFEGLGSPTFYFYPPLPFWTDALLSAVTFNVLSVPYRLAVTSVVILWASGLTMRAWLLGATGNRTAALLGALAYMAAPYHLLDHYMRGAFAELAAYALLPLIVLAIRLIADRRHSGLVLLALSYAGLVMSHLPTALLASVTVIPTYVLFRAWRLGERRAAAGLLLRCLKGGALGIGLAALYLVPALELQDWISADQLWTSFYRVENWFVLAPDRWIDPDTMRTIASLALAAVVLGVGLCIVLLQMPAGDPRRQEFGFWIAICLVCLALIVGLVPWFWDLPLLPKVQFPWRLMVVAEFAAITALCLTPFGALRRRMVYIFVAAAFAVAPGVVLIATDAAARIDFTWRHRPLDRHDAKEYQPRGYKQAGPRYGDLGLEPLRDVPAISCMPAARVCRVEDGSFGAMRITLDSDASTKVVLRRFFFPPWRIDADTPLAPSEPLQLVSFTVPAGRTTGALHRVTLPVEQWGWAISGLSLAVILGIAAVSARNTHR